MRMASHAKNSECGVMGGMERVEKGQQGTRVRLVTPNHVKWGNE